MLKRVRGFTIIDMLLTICITGILLTISLPTFSTARWKGTELKCMSNMRQAGLLLFTYATENKDYLPFQGWEARKIAVPGLGSLQMGDADGNTIMTGRWSFFFPDEWNSCGQWNRSLQCPMQPAFNREACCSGEMCWERERPTPTYEMSFALYNRADTMGPEHNPQDFEIGPNRVCDATFASQKVLLFEYPGFCMRDPNARSLALNLGKCFASKTSTLTFDGACRRFASKDSIDFPERGEAYFTVFGIQGRDLP